MRLLTSLLAIVSVFHPLTARTGETANARIWCLSLRFQEGTDSFGDTLDFSTINGTFNGELEPYRGQTYITAFTMDISGQPINGTMQLDLPPLVDVNNNGFSDFFESALAVGAGSSGSYTTDIGNGTVTASWQRGAGAPNGTCVLHLVDSVFGDLGSFTHTFQLLEYSGPLVYTPGSNSVTGTVTLRQTADPTSSLQGPFQFAKVATNRFNRLILQAGAWTNAAAQMLSFTNGLFSRDLPWTTNYYGFVQFADGDPGSGAPDYLVWLLSIDDSNDANRNGIPDLSDDPSTAPPPAPPQLVLSLTPTNLLLSVSGAVGRVQDFQQSASLPATNWQTAFSVTITNNPQLISIPYPAGPAAFWRALVH